MNPIIDVIMLQVKLTLHPSLNHILREAPYMYPLVILGNMGICVVVMAYVILYPVMKALKWIED